MRSHVFAHHSPERMCNKKNSLLGNNDESRIVTLVSLGKSSSMYLACTWSPASVNLISDQHPFPVLLVFLQFPCHTVFMGGFIPTIYPKPPPDVELRAILDITFSYLVSIQWYRVALQSFSAVHPNSTLFYNKNPYNCIFMCVLLIYCKMCWQ